MLIPGSKEAEQLEQKASDAFPARMERMYAEPIATLPTLGAENDHELETINCKYKYPVTSSIHFDVVDIGQIIA
jgi:hypothetical protein